MIYLHTDHIADWTKWQVVMLVGASHFIQQIFQAFFLTNCSQLSELIRTGPAGFHAAAAGQYAVSGFAAASGPGRICQRRFGAGGDGLRGAANCIWCLRRRRCWGSLLLCAAGVMIHYSLMFLLASVAFWTVRAQGIVWGYYSHLQHRAAAGRGVSGFFQAFFHLCHSDAAGGECAGETADQPA